MIISDRYSCPCGDWEATPRWLFWKPPFRRPLYAWWNIGGGFDGWEYSVSSQDRGTDA
jgi:hypothetical protein